MILTPVRVTKDLKMKRKFLTIIVFVVFNIVMFFRFFGNQSCGPHGCIYLSDVVVTIFRPIYLSIDIFLNTIGFSINIDIYSYYITLVLVNIALVIFLVKLFFYSSNKSGSNDENASI